MEKLWTTAEVAQCLGINEIDVEELVRQGKLTGYRLGGQFLRFRPGQVEALKGRIHFRPNTGKTASSRSAGGIHQMREFFYFYDFYLVSAVLLGVVAVYLIATG